MLQLTDCLKSWLIENDNVTETASDDEFRKAAYRALADGALTDEKVAELCSEADEEDAKEFENVLTDIVSRATAPLAEKVAGLEAKLAERPKQDADELADAIGKAVDKAAATEQRKERDGPKPAEIMQSGSRVRVKGAHEQYSTQKSAAYYPESHRHFPGERAMLGDTPLDHSSELDRAVSAAYFKFAANAGRNGHDLPRWLRMTDHDKQLVEYAVRELPWTGLVGGGYSEDPLSSGAIKIDGRRLTEFERKALLDDSTSGGLEAAPIVFDSAVLITPVLYGELFPLVSVVPVARGRRIEGFSMGNPTFTSGTAEGTSISLFNTASFIAAFDTTIYNAVGAMEIGNDFQQDSPVAIGTLVTQLYGQKALEWLDNQIANGDGTTEPQGVFNATGITDMGNPNGGANAAPQVVDYETLLFDVAKQYRTPPDRNRCVFIANDTSYRRSRSIAVSGTDQRRVFGMETNAHADYAILGYPYKVQNDMANTLAGFFNLRFYRMYRRLGLTVRIETGGKELALKNLTLIVVRMRWGGQLEMGGAGAYSDNWQT